jgi:hypothetical protein
MIYKAWVVMYKGKYVRFGSRQYVITLVRNLLGASLYTSVTQARQRLGGPEQGGKYYMKGKVVENRSLAVKEVRLELQEEKAMRVPRGWTIEGNKAIGRFGKAYDILSCGKVCGKGWPLTITVTLKGDNLIVSTNDENASYTSGSVTTANIPLAVLTALGVNAKAKED